MRKGIFSKWTSHHKFFDGMTMFAYRYELFFKIKADENTNDNLYETWELHCSEISQFCSDLQLISIN